MNFAHIESPRFEFLSHNWPGSSDQQTPEIGSVYRKLAVLSNFRSDQEWIVSTPVDTRFFRPEAIQEIEVLRYSTYHTTIEHFGFCKEW